ncbi:MAG: hypothetical protein R2861_05375 [Desulfobacterales bacterium]
MINEKKQIAQFTCRVISGEGQGPALVFLHGLMFTGEIWHQIGLLPTQKQRTFLFA